MSFNICCQYCKACCNRCKENKVTVQAAVSAASMLTMAKMQAGLSPLPANMLVQVPINMRKQVSTASMWSTLLNSLSALACTPCIH